MSYTITEAAATRLRRTHVIKTRVELWSGSNFLRFLYPESGQVNAENAAIRRKLTFTIPDTDGTLTPNDPTDLLAPYGNEIRPYRGVVFDDGTEEMFPLGVFGIEETRVVDSGAKINLNVVAYDRAKKVQRARTLDYYTIASGTNFATAIQNLISAGVSGLSYSFSSTAETTPQIVIEPGRDRWEVAQKMAKDIGMSLFFDVNGICTMRPVADPSVQPSVWDFVEGSNATLLYVDARKSREGIYNHVIVVGNGGETPVRAEAKDDNPLSPTYYLGPFGDVPYFYTSEFIHTTSQAQAVADALLLSQKGFEDLVNLSVVPAPHLEVGDVVDVERQRAGVNAKYTINSFALPLSAKQPMPCSVRRAIA